MHNMMIPSSSTDFQSKLSHYNKFQAKSSHAGFGKRIHLKGRKRADANK